MWNPTWPSRTPVAGADVDKSDGSCKITYRHNDEDVNFIEVEHLMQVLTAAGKDFEYEVYDVPGGHSFDRLDTPEARAGPEIYAFCPLSQTAEPKDQPRGRQ